MNFFIQRYFGLVASHLSAIQPPNKENSQERFLKSDTQHAIRKQSFIDFICLFINPAVAFLLLQTITYVKDVSFEKPYLVLGGMAFAFLFPGTKLVNVSMIKMIHKIVVNWLVISTLLIFFVHLTEYNEIINNDVLLNWLVSTPLMLIAVNGSVRLLINRLYSTETNLRNIIIVGGTSAGLKLGYRLRKNHLAGMRLVGYFDDRTYERVGIEKKRNYRLFFRCRQLYQ